MRSSTWQLRRLTWVFERSITSVVLFKKWLSIQANPLSTKIDFLEQLAMAMRTCNISARSVFLFNIITVLVLVTYLVDLEKKIANAKVSSQHNSDLLNTQVNGINSK
jgi:hypothetical protein